MAEIKIVTFILLIALASPAVNQYLTGKVKERYLVEQRELLLKDVSDCSERPEVSLIENIKLLYQCLRRRIIHCDSRRQKSLQSAQLAQNKSRIYCTSIIHKGVYPTHQAHTVNIQTWSNFILHIDFLLFDFEWYSQVYHGLSVSEYNRDGGRNTTYYTGRRLPWTMITTSNTAIMNISTYARMIFKLHLYYSSTKWSWYPNIKAVYAAILSDVAYPVNLVTTLQLANRIFEAFTYHFIQPDFKQINISFVSIVESPARIVIYDGPGRRSPRLLTVEHHDSMGKTLIKTTAFHAYIEVYILPFEATQPIDILFSQIESFDYPRLKFRHIDPVTVHSDDRANNIFVIPWMRSVLDIRQYIFEGVFTAMPGYETPKCQFGGLYFIPSQNKAFCKTIRTRFILEHDGSVESLMVVWFSGYSRGSLVIIQYVNWKCLTHHLDNHIVQNNNIFMIDTIQYCRKYVCPESMNPSHDLRCEFQLNIPNRPVGSAELSVGLSFDMDDCAPGTGTTDTTASYTVSTIEYTHARFGYNIKKHNSGRMHDSGRITVDRFKHLFQYLVSANVSLPRLCFQRIISLRSYMRVYIAICQFNDLFQDELSLPVHNIFSLDNCINHTTRMKPNSLLIRHENYTINYPRHHIITSYAEYCPHRCRNHSFDLKIYRKFDNYDNDRVDMYSAKIGEKISTQLTYDTFWIKINRQETSCQTGECTLFVKISDEDELSGIDLKQAASRHYRFHNVRYV